MEQKRKTVTGLLGIAFAAPAGAAVLRFIVVAVSHNVENASGTEMRRCRLNCNQEAT